MKKNYETPKIEVLEIELEDLLCASPGHVTIDDIEDDGDAW